MKNLFNFDYEIQAILNKDLSKSRFSIVYGQNGAVIHTKKDSYSIIDTLDLSMIGTAFLEAKKEVSSFVHKSGEVIGLNISLSNNTLTEVGEKNYNAVITVPNNGGGMGYLAIKETRLICTNGMTRSKILNKINTVKIPHNLSYKKSIELMNESLFSFTQIIKEIEEQDHLLNSAEISEKEIQKIVENWFFAYEYPASQKGKMTFVDFQRYLYEDHSQIKCIARFYELEAALKDELHYNKILGLKNTLYTAFATVTNYLSRRVEKSKADAPEEIIYLRNEEKISNFHKLVY